MLAFLRGEAAADRVEKSIRSGAACCWINLGEVLYKQARTVGWETADTVICALASNLRALEMDANLVRAAAAIKAGGGLSYADCFAVATAERREAPLLTGDPEIVGLDRPGLEVIDLRA